MKISTKIILPIILISALLISLSGCAPTTPSPGATTGGTITGIFETPEACCISNRDHTEGWVPLVNATVSVIDSKGVTHTTKTDSDGKYWLTDVAPGIYYVVTACCECEDREGVYKDVAEEELKEGETYDAGIADCESTALGLMVDYLLSGDVFVGEDCNDYCNCFDEESQIYASLVTTGVKLRVAGINLLNPATKPLEKIKTNADFKGFVVELCDLLEACCVEPAVTPPPPPPPPPPDPCDGNLAPIIDSVESDGQPVVENSTVNVVLGESYDIVVTAHDQDTKLGTLTYYATVNGAKSPVTTTGQVTVKPALPGIFEVYVYVNDGCTTTTWGPVMVEVHDECYDNTAPELTVPASLTIDAGTTYTGTASAIDDGIKFGLDLVFSASIAPTPTNGLTIDPSTGEISWVSDCDDIVGDDLTDYVVTVTVDDGCEPVSDSFIITLDPEVCDPCYDNTAPEVIVPDDSLGIFVAAGSTYDADIFMSDIDLIKDPLTYTISISPPVTNSLVITPITGGVHISWDTDCDDIVDGVNTEYSITVEAFDGCDPTIKSFTITLLAEPCVPCSLSLQVKEGGKLVEYLDDLPFTTTVLGDITYITYDDIIVGTNASKLWFRICASPDAVMEYNFYRGGSCPDEWDYDDGSVGTPPGWSPVLDSKFNTQYYPDGYPKPSPDDLIICNTGDPNEPVNILMVKVTEGNLITIYMFNIFR